MVADAHQRAPKGFGDQAISSFCRQRTLDDPLNAPASRMAAHACEQASESLRAKAIPGVCWHSTFDKLLNAAVDRMREVLRATRSRERRVQSSGLSSYEAAELAKEEWLSAVEYFHEVSEPDLVDYAVYSLRAAERKYMYLLDKARKDYASLS